MSVSIISTSSIRSNFFFSGSRLEWGTRLGGRTPGGTEGSTFCISLGGTQDLGILQGTHQECCHFQQHLYPILDPYFHRMIYPGGACNFHQKRIWYLSRSNQQGNWYFPTGLVQVLEQLSNIVNDGCKGFDVILSHMQLWARHGHWDPLSSLKTSWMLPKLTVSTQSLSSALTASMNITSE